MLKIIYPRFQNTYEYAKKKKNYSPPFPTPPSDTNVLNIQDKSFVLNKLQYKLNPMSSGVPWTGELLEGRYHYTKAGQMYGTQQKGRTISSRLTQRPNF